ARPSPWWNSPAPSSGGSSASGGGPPRCRGGNRPRSAPSGGSARCPRNGAGCGRTARAPRRTLRCAHGSLPIARLGPTAPRQACRQPSRTVKVGRESSPRIHPSPPCILEETSVPTSLAVPGVADTPTPEERQSVLATLRRPAWLKTEVLGGLVVALALIPAAIACAVIAGVDPRVGLFASVTGAVTTAILGGRPAMISAATGAVALVIAPLMASHGLHYLIAAVILAGVFQVVLALLGAARLMRFIPRQVMVGFVNA